MASLDAAERHQSAVNRADPLEDRGGHLLRTGDSFAMGRLQESVGHPDACWSDMRAPEFHLLIVEPEAENFGATGVPDVG